jgi:hypothetical protein
VLANVVGYAQAVWELGSEVGKRFFKLHVVISAEYFEALGILMLE